MQTPAWRKCRAKLLAGMNARVTLLNNRRAKLISLLLTTTVWYLIKKNVETTPRPLESFSEAEFRKRAEERLINLTRRPARLGPRTFACYPALKGAAEGARSTSGWSF